jgi:plasmid maintenance system antidote protein VapI
MDIDDIHIGKAIRQKMQEQGMFPADLAAAIHCDRTNIYAIFRRKSIDTELLVRISHVLCYDFYTELYLRRQPFAARWLLVELDETTLQKLRSKCAVKLP